MKKLVARIIMSIMVLQFFIVPSSVYAGTTELSSDQISQYCRGKVGQNYPNGMCLAFVADQFQALGATRSSACCAYNYGSSHITSTSRSNITVGADVFFTNCGGGPCKNCGSRYYGHVGIYVGNNQFVHATGGKVRIESLDNSYWSPRFRGWGVHGNIRIKDTPVSWQKDNRYPVPITTYPAATSGKLVVYSDNGTEYPINSRYISYNDKCTITAIYTNGFCNVQYPTSSGTSRGMARTSDFIQNGVEPHGYKSPSNVDAYARSDMRTKIGTVYNTDACTTVCVSGNKMQVIYPVTGGYKMGWIQATSNPTPSVPSDFSDGYAGIYVVTTNSLDLNMRSGPGQNYPVVTCIPKGSEVSVAKGNGTWAYVSYNGKNGYCSMQYLTKKQSHVMTKVNAKKATCTERGNIEYYHCNHCNKNFKDSQGKTEVGDVTIPADGNNHVGGTRVVNKRESTCYEKGYTGDTVCAGCGKTIAWGHEIDFKAHSYDSSWQSDADQHWHECSVCGAKNGQEAHIYGNWEITKQPTADTEGIKERRCTVCGYTQTASLEKHILTKVDAKESTCVLKGNVEYYHCNHCGKNFKDSQGRTEITDVSVAVNPNNHAGGTTLINRKEATCTDYGYTGDTVCINCGKTIVQGHRVEIKNHTCGNDWKTNTSQHWHECTMCGETLDQGYHSYGDWVVTKQATFQEEGIKERRCTICGYTQRTSIPVLVAQSGWMRNSTGWWYQYEDGSYVKNEFKEIAGKTYYFGYNGYMLTGWNQINGKYYYFYPDGHMAMNETIDGYYVDQQGIMI